MFQLCPLLQQADMWVAILLLPSKKSVLVFKYTFDVSSFAKFSKIFSFDLSYIWTELLLSLSQLFDLFS